MSSTVVSRHLRAPRERVYRALTDARAISRWRVPLNMRSEVHEFDVRQGGRIRVSLTYERPGAAGKTSACTDTYHGHFVELVENERVVEELEFETSDRAMQGLMRVAIELRDEAGGTSLRARHDGLPAGVAPADNELGWQESLTRLAVLVEGEGG